MTNLNISISDRIFCTVIHYLGGGLGLLHSLIVLLRLGLRVPVDGDDAWPGVGGGPGARGQGPG